MSRERDEAIGDGTQYQSIDGFNLERSLGSA